MPQAVRIDTNLDVLDLLHRDVVNVCTWFSRRSVEVDGEEIDAELSASIVWVQPPRSGVRTV